MTDLAGAAGTARDAGRLDSTELELALERHRTELTAHCYRMLGAAFEAEDAVQETLVRAWRSYERFEGRAALRSWLYRIATNVCFDMLNGRERRARPMDLGPSGAPDGPLGGTLPEVTWIEPMPDSRVLGESSDPAEQAMARESVSLALIAALQYLPPRQRAVLILREVLRWKATEVAELLDTTVTSVNSALQRARATLTASGVTSEASVEPLDAAQRALLERYVDAFQRYDMASLTEILHEDATQSMPPFELWLTGRDDVLTFWQGHGAACRDSRLVPVGTANGLPAFGQYKPGSDGGLEPWSIQVIEVSGDRVVAVHSFLDTQRLFPLFGLPLEFED